MIIKELIQKTDENILQTHNALLLLYNSLPPGQQRTVIKNKAVKELLIRYNIITSKT